MSYLFSQKDYATFKIDIFWNMGVGEENFKLFDILVPTKMSPRGTNGKTRKRDKK